MSCIFQKYKLQCQFSLPRGLKKQSISHPLTVGGLTIAVHGPTRVQPFEISDKKIENPASELQTDIKEKGICIHLGRKLII